MTSLDAIVPSAYPLGGVQTWLDYLIEGLSGDGWNVSLGLASGDYHRPETYLAVHPFDQVDRITAPTGSRRGRSEAVADVVERLRPGVVLGVNIADVYPGVALARTRSGIETKVVATLHGFGADFLEDIREYSGVIDAVAVTNRLTAALVEHQCGISSERIFYCPCGVPVDEAGALPDPSAAGPLRVGYVGRFDEDQKRVSDLVEILRLACAGDQAVRLVLAGDGPAKPAVMAAFERAGLSDWVEDLGRVPAEECIERVYRQIDVLLITSSWETGPIVAWEAMSENVSVVTSDYLGRKCEGSLIDDENCLVFPVGDCAAAAAALERMSDRKTRERLAEAGRRLVVERYSRTASVASWDAALRQVLELPPLPMAKVPSIPPRGRLDRLLGVEWGEKVRRALGIRFKHHSAGGEWPHSYGGATADEAAFWRLAAELDRSSPSPCCTTLIAE